VSFVEIFSTQFLHLFFSNYIKDSKNIQEIFIQFIHIVIHNLSVFNAILVDNLAFLVILLYFFIKFFLKVKRKILALKFKID